MRRFIPGISVAGTLNDEAIWDIVAFLRQMPSMSPETYQQLSMSHAN